MVETNPGRKLTFEQRVRAMSPKELYEQLAEENAVLAYLHVTTPISIMILGAVRYGDRYEDRVDDQGERPITSMNCFMGLLYEEPGLRVLSGEQFSRLVTTISRIAMATEALRAKGRIDWPEIFQQAPQR